MRNQGFGPQVFDGRPVIGIPTTWSELAPCNAHLHRLAEGRAGLRTTFGLAGACVKVGSQ